MRLLRQANVTGDGSALFACDVTVLCDDVLGGDVDEPREREMVLLAPAVRLRLCSSEREEMAMT